MKFKKSLEELVEFFNLAVPKECMGAAYSNFMARLQKDPSLVERFEDNDFFLKFYEVLTDIGYLEVSEREKYGDFIVDGAAFLYGQTLGQDDLEDGFQVYSIEEGEFLSNPLAPEILARDYFVDENDVGTVAPVDVLGLEDFMHELSLENNYRVLGCATDSRYNHDEGSELSFREGRIFE